MFDSAADRAGLRLTVDCPPLPEPVYVDRDTVGQDRAQPAVQRLEVHLRGRHHRPRSSADGRPRVLRSATPGSASRRRRCRTCSSGSTGSAVRRSRTHEGSGIGLALVAELVALHGGTVAVDSVPGAGTTFTRPDPVRQRAPAGRPGRVASDRRSDAVAGRRRASSARRCAGWTTRRRSRAGRPGPPAVRRRPRRGRAAGPGRRRQRRHAGVRRGAAARRLLRA